MIVTGRLVFLFTMLAALMGVFIMAPYFRIPGRFFADGCVENGHQGASCLVYARRNAMS